MILADNRDAANPYLNLAIEEFLVRHADCTEHDFLLLYINEPCIVLGKNQSIYREVNFDFLRDNKLKLARRISGGGTVYHDTGNLNFSIITKFADEKINNYKFLNRHLIEALQNAGIDAAMDERNNIICRGKKISGNAQFTNRRNILSHGTLLIDADLDTLRNCLTENSFKIETKAVRSVSSPVINISDLETKIKSARELKSYLQQVLTTPPIYHFDQKEWNEIQKLANDKFQSFEWLYGRSPRTKIIKDEIEIDIVDGLISEIKIKGSLQIPDLTGVRYTNGDIKKALESHPKTSELIALLF